MANPLQNIFLREHIQNCAILHISKKTYFASQNIKTQNNPKYHPIGFNATYVMMIHCCCGYKQSVLNLVITIIMNK